MYTFDMHVWKNSCFFLINKTHGIIQFCWNFQHLFTNKWTLYRFRSLIHSSSFNSWPIRMSEFLMIVIFKYFIKLNPRRWYIIKKCLISNINTYDWKSSKFKKTQKYFCRGWLISHFLASTGKKNSLMYLWKIDIYFYSTILKLFHILVVANKLDLK